MRTPLASNQTSSGPGFFFSRIFPLIFILVGGAVATFGIRGLLRAGNSKNWPSVDGKIVESQVKSKRSSGSSGTSTSYHAEVRYEYTVDGTAFTGTRVAYGDFGSSFRSHAEGIVERHPKGKTVTVHYMPNDPEECLIEPGVKGQSFIWPGFGLFFFGIGCALAVFLPKMGRKPTTTDHLRPASEQNG